MAVPEILFVQLAKLGSLSSVAVSLSEAGLYALVQITTIYVLPIVFIKNEGVFAVLAGVTYLFLNLRGSLPIIILVTAMLTVYFAAVWISIETRSLGAGMLSMVIIMGVVNVVYAYLSFLVFAAATMVLSNPKMGFAGVGD